MKRLLIATLAVALYTLAPTGSMFARTTAAPASLKGQTQVDPPIPSVIIQAAEYRYTAPAEMPAGIVSVTLHNTGKTDHDLLFLRVKNGKTRADLLNALSSPTLVEQVADSFGGVGRTPAGQSRQAVLDLQEGEYLIISIEPSDGRDLPDVAKGMQAWIKVVASPNPAVAPHADIVASMKDGIIALPASIPAGTHTFEVRSEGVSPHRLILVKLQSGKTMVDFTAWIKGRESGPPPSSGWDGPHTLSTGKHGWFTMELTVGEYVVFCSPNHPNPYETHFLAGENSSFTVIAQAPEGIGIVKAGSGALPYVWLLVLLTGLLILIGFKLRSYKLG